MDNAIVDMVLGLVLLYLLLALLATKVQEYWDGQWRGGRALVMHDLLLEAVGRNATLKKNILENPAVFALYRGEDEPERHTGLSWFQSAATGPSKIPADLFARTLLVELHADGKGSHPSARYSTPEAFIADKAPTSAPQDDSNRIWRTLRSLLAGREADWSTFEHAIARWFSDIGDRADGWFQRRSAKFSLAIALLLAMGLNADSIHVADQLSRDAELRASVSTLAQRVNALFPGGEAASKDAAAAALKEIAPVEAPLTRADRLLKESITRIGRVFWNDDDVARTKFDQWQLEYASKPALAPQQLVASCARRATGVFSTPGQQSTNAGHGKNETTREFLSNPSTWVLVLPAIRTSLHQLDALPELPSPMASEEPASKPTAAPPATTPSSPTAATSTASMPPADSVAQRSASDGTVASPAASAAPSPPKTTKTSRTGSPAQSSRVTSPVNTEKAGKVQAELPELASCLSLLSGQVRTVAAMRGEATQAGADLLAAADALDGAREAVHQQTANRQDRLPVARLFQRDPELFKECALARPPSQEALRRCVEAGAQGRARLPVFHTSDNRRIQFCAPVTLRDETPSAGMFVRTLCGDTIVEGDARLGFPDGLRLVGAGFGTVVFWFIGCLMTAFFVALGAPFWFDVLGKVSKVRAAGNVRPPEPTPPASTDEKRNAAAADGTSQQDPFNLARNIVEKAMLPPDIIAMQRGLGVAGTGVFDAPTRAAIAARAKTEGLDTGDEVSLILYERIVGRSIAAAIVPRPDGSLVRGEAHPFATTLAERLLPLLNFKQAERFVGGSLPTTFDDDLRALGVLYRYKSQTVAPHQRTAVTMASDNRAALDSLDLAQAKEIMDLSLKGPPFPGSMARDVSAPWLDWALGELGQIEQDDPSPAKSNPRVLEYLKACKIAGQGDKTAWCAAFVTWVLDRARNDTAQPPKSAIPKEPTQPESSLSWIGWGTPTTFATAVPGDIICLKLTPQNPNAVDHLAIVLEMDVPGQAVWAIGGNQGGRGQVKVSRFKEAEVKHWRSPS